MTDAITGGKNPQNGATLGTDPFKGHQRVKLEKMKQGKQVLNGLGEPIVDTYFRPNIPLAKRTDGWKDVQQVRWLFADCDRDDITNEQQNRWFLEAVPVAASYSLATGGRGVHHHWEIEPQTREVGKALQLLLIRQCAFSDQSIQCPSRLMRAPGSVHGATGKAVETLTSTGVVHAYPALKLFPCDGGEGGKTTKAAMLAAHYLAHKGMGEGTIRAIAEAHGWAGNRLKPILDPAARGSAAKDDGVNLGPKTTAVAVDADGTVTRVRELVTQALAWDGSGAEQKVKLRLLLAADGLDRVVSDGMLTSLLAERTAPDLMQFDTEEADVAEASLTGPFVTGAFNLLVAAAKTGKTWAICDWVRKALAGERETFAGRVVEPVDHALMISLDQGAASNKTMFRAMGLTEQGGAEDGRRSYCKGLTVVQRGTFSFSMLRKWSATHPGAIIVVDSLSAIRPRNLSENDAGIASFLAGFQGLPGDPTLVLVHHAGKTAIREARTRMDIIRGSGAIQGAVDWVTTLEAPLTKDSFGNWMPDKRSKERRICGEGRSLAPFEIYLNSRSYDEVPGADFGQDNQGSFGVKPDSHRYDGEKAGGVYEKNRKKLEEMILALIYDKPRTYSSPAEVAVALGKHRTNKAVKGLLVNLECEGLVLMDGGYVLNEDNDGTDGTQGKDDDPQGAADAPDTDQEAEHQHHGQHATTEPVEAAEEDLNESDPGEATEPSGDEADLVDDEIAAIRDAAMGGGCLQPGELLDDAGLEGTAEQHDLVKRMLKVGELKITNGRYFRGDGEPHEATQPGDRVRWNLDHLEGEPVEGFCDPS